jgi:hypothetical protein
LEEVLMQPVKQLELVLLSAGIVIGYCLSFLGVRVFACPLLTPACCHILEIALIMWFALGWFIGYGLLKRGN